jgi:hypothetical protein
MHCHNFAAAPLSRRDMLARCASGFGSIALAALLAEETRSDTETRRDPFATRPTHFAPRAKNVIFLFMDGGPSQIDTFDPKPRLTREDGQPFGDTIEPTQFNNNGATFGCPWKFAQHGQSGIAVSELFPHVARCVDDLAIVRSVVSNFSEHTTANYFLHTGSGLQGRPSMGAWATYGLGSECRDLPGFVVLNGGTIPPGGLDNFNSGFLPATYQGSIFRPTGAPVANIRSADANEQLQRNKLALLDKLDRHIVERSGSSDAIESAIANYETAFRMQAVVPQLVDLSGEPAATKRRYGLDAEFSHTRTYGSACLLARRLVEQGVRFIELTCPPVGDGADRWDQHSNLKSGHEANSRAVDQPIAALLMDLKQRGLLDTTLVV